jgi:hypothetical protein
MKSLSTEKEKKQLSFLSFYMLIDFFAILFVMNFITHINTDTATAVIVFALLTLHVDICDSNMMWTARHSMFTITSFSIYLHFRVFDELYC